MDSSTSSTAEKSGLSEAAVPYREYHSSCSQSPNQSSVVTPIGKARRVPIDFFLHDVLPPLPTDLDLDALLDTGVFSKVVTLGDRLWGYEEKTPSGIHTADVFHAFSSLQSGIHTTVISLGHLEPRLIFFNRVSVSDNPGKRRRMHNDEAEGEDSLPDAFFVPVSTTHESVKWTDVAVLGEYQRDDSPESVEENVKKISRSMSNCMWKDPRRRFIYGFTVEDASMRLWYCDRSQIVVSDPFDFIVDYRTLIYFVISISFAEHHQLGWDPTMTPIDKDGERQYKITVRISEEESIVYRTSQVLYDGGVQVLGRGTRVWKAVKIVDGAITGEPVAIKDVWVDEHREREGDICSQIFQSETSAANRDELRRYIVAVTMHGDVFVAGRQDRTKTLHDACSSVEEAPQGSRTSVKPMDKRSQGAIGSSRYQVHYRVVYGEIGEPLAGATSLYTVFRVLTDVVHGVSALHQAGWVHRDLSAGNILIVNGMGKITDLEYATSEARPKKTGKTGTPFFVSVEVYAQEYLFRPERKVLNKEEIDAWVAKRSASVIRKPRSVSPPFEVSKTSSLSPSPGREISKTPSLPPRPEPIYDDTDTCPYEFRYNPLHDMESIWWNAVYFSINRKFERKKDQASSTGGPTAAQRAFAQSLFYELERRDVFRIVGYFPGHVRCLRRSLTHVARILDWLRDCLLAAYKEAERSRLDLIDSQVAKDLYSRFGTGFDKAMRSLKEDDSAIRPFPDIVYSM